LKLERKDRGAVGPGHKNQKEFYLNEQLKAIRKELVPERVFDEVDDLIQR